MATFFWARSASGEQEVESFTGQVLRIGRGTNAELRFAEKTIELEHASITFDDGSYLLRDLHSTTGVWVGGERIRSVKLRDGDTIELGGWRLKVKWEAATDPLFLQIEPLAFDPELSTVIHTFKASSQALVVLAELEAQRLARDPGASPTDDDTFIRKILPELDLPAGDTELLTRRLPAQPRPRSESFAEGFTELLEARPDPDTKRRKEAAAGKKSGAPPLVPQPQAALPPPPPPLPVSPAKSPANLPGARPAAGLAPGLAPAGPARRPQRGRGERLDYENAYLLPAFPTKIGVTIAALLATALIFWQLWSHQGSQIFAPGPLAKPHQTLKACSDCHSGFRPVSDLSCRSACHPGIGDHQNAGLRLETGQLACIDCHNEHHGLEALKLFRPNACNDCHGDLKAQLPGSVFTSRITDFESDHPEFAIDTPTGRRRLDEPGGREIDPGGLILFDHSWHLTKLPAQLRRGCDDCHPRDPKSGEILPLDFKTSCQSCHSLPFDSRFPGKQAPHSATGDVLNFLIGTYLQNPQILARLDDKERVAAAGSLTREQQLAKVAQVVGDRLLRVNCAKCHRFENKDPAKVPPGAAQLARVEVAPVLWRERFFLHANFQHAPHVQIAECADCHAGASTSKKPGDLLLPSITSCQTCHRRPEAAKVDDSRIGEKHCLNCHTYHPTPGQLQASRTPSQEAP